MLVFLKSNSENLIYYYVFLKNNNNNVLKNKHKTVYFKLYELFFTL